MPPGRTRRAGLEQQVDHAAALARASEAQLHRYSALFDALEDPTFVTDVLGVLVHVNRAAASRLGLEGGRLAGKPMAVFVALEDRRRFRDAITAVQRGDPVPPLTLRMTPARRATAFTAEVRAVALPEEGMLWVARVDDEDGPGA